MAEAHAHDPAHAAHAEHAAHGEHPTAGTYVKVGVFLTVITVVEVWAYYIPSLVASAVFIPALLIMSAVKFATVVLFYMHLKYDHRVFKALFTGPLLIAMGTVVGLLFLFGKVALRLAA